MKILSSAAFVKRVIFGMFVGGGGTTKGLLEGHLVLEISVSQEALHITSNIRQEVLSRTCKAFFTIV